jgi:hypothetical protein
LQGRIAGDLRAWVPSKVGGESADLANSQSEYNRFRVTQIDFDDEIRWAGAVLLFGAIVKLGPILLEYLRNRNHMREERESKLRSRTDSRSAGTDRRNGESKLPYATDSRSARTALFEGIPTLEKVLRPNGFMFRFLGEGTGAGGHFAWGECVRDDRRLELHVRYNLGLVRYHAGNVSASHENYMRELGVWDSCQYPNFSDDPKAAFEALAHDLTLAEDFLTGPAIVLREAAAKEAASEKGKSEALRVQDAGDTRIREKLRMLFREKRYKDVVNCAQQLKFPDQMTKSEHKMIEIARTRSSG